MTADCAFCSIIRGDLKAEILHSNDQAIAILDINPIHYGHVLVMPRAHCSTFLELSGDDLDGVARATQVVARAIVEALKPPGYNIFSNNGEAAGQSVFHFHFHVTPRYIDDDIQFILKLKKYAANEMSRYAARLREHIKNDSIHI